MRMISVIFGLVFAISCGSAKKPADAAPDSGPPTANAPDGSAPSGLSCPMTPSCGGDPVGVWKMVSFCYSNEMLEKEFGAGEVARCQMHFGVEYVGMGTFTFTADGRHATNFDGKAYEAVSMTEECMQSEKYAMFNKGANCTSSGGIRTCRIGGGSDDGADGGKEDQAGRYLVGKSRIMTMIDRSTDGTYTVSDTLMFESKRQHQDVSMLGYCVTGDTLTITVEGVYATFVKIPGALPPSVPPMPAPDSPAPVPAPTSVGPAFEEAISCGGNLLGTWNITGIAISEGLQRDLIDKVRYFDPDGECAYKIDVADTGTVTFKELAIRTGSCSIHEEPSLVIVYSSACLAGKTKTCAELVAPRQAEAAAYDPQAVVACAPTADGNCACTQSRKYALDDCEYETELGTEDYYQIGSAGSTFTQFQLSSTMVGYCVNGNTLKIPNSDFSIYGLYGRANVTAERIAGAPPLSAETLEPGVPTACPNVTKCGGKIAGSWEITAACLSPKAFMFTDPTMSSVSNAFADSTKLWSCVKSLDVKGTGKAEFAESGSFSMSLALKMMPVLDEKCLSSNKRPACGPALEQTLSFAYPGIKCSSDGKGLCNCTYVTRYSDIGSGVTSANGYGGIQTYKEVAGGTLEILSKYDSKSVTADFVSKLEDQYPADFGTINVRLTDAGVYYCVQGDTLALYAGRLVNDMYLDVSGRRIK